MSLAVVYRSEARFDRAFRQMRSSSFGIVSSHLPGRTSFPCRDLLQQFRL